MPESIIDSDHAVCPNCKYEQGDMWDYLRGDEETAPIECPQCGLTFQVTQHVNIYYESEPIAKNTDAADG